MCVVKLMKLFSYFADVFSICITLNSPGLHHFILKPNEMKLKFLLVCIFKLDVLKT